MREYALFHGDFDSIMFFYFGPMDYLPMLRKTLKGEKMETHQASNNMRKFFERLIELKMFVKDELNQDPRNKALKHIWHEMESLIKISEEDNNEKYT